MSSTRCLKIGSNNNGNDGSRVYSYDPKSEVAAFIETVTLSADVDELSVFLSALKCTSLSWVICAWVRISIRMIEIVKRCAIVDSITNPISLPREFC